MRMKLVHAKNIMTQEKPACTLFAYFRYSGDTTRRRHDFLADCTNGRAYATASRPFVVCNVMYFG